MDDLTPEELFALWDYWIAKASNTGPFSGQSPKFEDRLWSVRRLQHIGEEIEIRQAAEAEKGVGNGE